MGRQWERKKRRGVEKNVQLNKNNKKYPNNLLPKSVKEIVLISKNVEEI